MTPAEMRKRAHDISRRADELEAVEKTIKFLQNSGSKPDVTVRFSAWSTDEASQAASSVREYLQASWDHQKVLEHFTARRDALKRQFA